MNLPTKGTTHDELMSDMLDALSKDADWRGGKISSLVYVIDIYAVADALDEMGWYPDRQQLPPSLHCMVTPAHKDIAQPFLADLTTAVRSVKETRAAPAGRAATYGMLGTLPDRRSVRNVILDSIDRLTQIQGRGQA